MLKSSLNGLAFTTFIICISQHQANGGESFCAMEFATLCSKLRCNVKKPKPKNIDMLIKAAENDLALCTKTLKNLEAAPRQEPTAKIFQKQMIDKSIFLKDLYSKIKEW